MSVGERDPHTGHMTTGHEWNGIKELNTPVPRVVWLALAVTILFSVGYWILMPAWPLGVTYTRGLLGIEQRAVLERQVQQAEESRSVWMSRFASEEFETIQADEALMARVRTAGSTLFGDNCAVCHGGKGEGAFGYPSLADGSWLWGGSPAEIAETLRVGINDSHPETHIAMMPAFGRDGILNAQEVRDVVAYVMSLRQENAALSPSEEAGSEVYAEHCALCHGPGGGGDTSVGAPDLRGAGWTYGGDWKAITRSVHHGRAGHMPAWEGRLTEAERRLLALYVLELQEGAAE